MITFGQDFESETNDYTLFELPDDIQDQIEAGDSITIKQYQEDCFFVSKSKIYELERVDISNTLLVSEQVQQASGEPSKAEEPKFVTRAIKQFYFSAKECIPQFSDIMGYLLRNAIGEGDYEYRKKELSLKVVFERFVLSSGHLKDV